MKSRQPVKVIKELSVAEKILRELKRDTHNDIVAPFAKFE